MEVHSHIHSPGKKWTHYLWEFLMLFLAVFCGFLAENLREKQLEHRKEKEYMHALIKDIQKDTALINRCIRQISFVISGHDSLEKSLESNFSDPENMKKLYYENAAFTLVDFFVDFTKGTFEELKSSGNLRLVNSIATKEKLKDYETVKEWCKDQHTFSYESIMKTYFFATDIFDITCYRRYSDWLNIDWLNNMFLPFDSIKQYFSENPRLLTNDKLIIKKYERLVNNEKAQMMGYLSYIRSANQTAVELINTIKKEYDFE